MSASRFILGVAVLACVAQAHAYLVPCDAADSREIDAALAQIERSVDPCGDSPEVAALLALVRTCSVRTYRICSSSLAGRNELDRPLGSRGEPLARTITWNPTLRSELETSHVVRDPTASLLHELAHAADDCLGRNPGERELEAVAVENIYRRAAGLSQRTRYGDQPLPVSLVKECTPTRCTCATPAGSSVAAGTDGHRGSEGFASGDAMDEP